MIQIEFNQEIVDHVNQELDAAGLAEYARQLVVVGGMAMRAQGITMPDDYRASDIDIVASAAACINLRDREHQPSLSGTDDRSFRLGGAIDVLEMPIDSVYQADSQALVAERLVPANSRYGFLPLVRVLDWKLAIAASHRNIPGKDKHLQHARLLSQALLARDGGGH